MDEGAIFSGHVNVGPDTGKGAGGRPAPQQAGAQQRPGGGGGPGGPGAGQPGGGQPAGANKS